MGLPVKKADHKFTYKDYCTWPEDERWELIDGTAYDMSPAPLLDHQRIAGNIFTSIKIYLSDKECEPFIAPFDIFFPETEDQDINDVVTVVQPDISVICDKSKLMSRGCFGAPNLLIEILSPSTMKKDLRQKFDLYQNSGVREYWIVDPGNKFVRVYQLQEDGLYDDGILYAEEGCRVISSVLEGFELPYNEIFETAASSG